MKRFLAFPVITLLALAGSSSAQEVTDFDRFRLWNGCEPVGLLVERLPDDATEIGLTKEDIEISVRSRLRGARIYSEFERTSYHLYVNINVVGAAFNIILNYNKPVNDIASNTYYRAATYKSGTTGTHGRDANYILSAVSQETDKFIDQYLRVNAEAC